MNAVRIGAALAVGLWLALAAAVPALADSGFGTRLPGRHVYDSAAVLSSSDVASLETPATNLDRAGAPIIVFVRVKEADNATMQQDARELMDAWQIESSTGVRDGVVVLLNLEPGNTRHGSGALAPGPATSTTAASAPAGGRRSTTPG